MYREFVDHAAADANQSVEFDRSGTLQIALNADEATKLRDATDSLSAHGVAHTLFDAAALRRFDSSVTPEAVGALHIPDQGYVAAADLTRVLAAAAARRGATFDAIPVLGVEGGDAARVRTAKDLVESDVVIIAAGSWSPTLAEPHANATAVKPIRGQLLQLRLRERPTPRIIWGGACYLVPRQDGAVLAGATVEDVGFDERATLSGVAHLLEAAVALMPQLRDAAFEEVRVGLRPMTRDELPAVGPSSTMPHVFYATGHYRNGILLAPLTARLVADLVLLGRVDDELALLRPERLGL